MFKKVPLKNKTTIHNQGFTDQFVELVTFCRAAALTFREWSLGKNSLNRNDRSICYKRQDNEDLYAILNKTWNDHGWWQKVKCWDTHIYQCFVFLTVLEKIKNRLHVRLLQDKIVRIYRESIKINLRLIINSQKKLDIISHYCRGVSPTSGTDQVVRSAPGLVLLLIGARRRRRCCWWKLWPLLVTHSVDERGHLPFCWIHLVEERVHFSGEEYNRVTRRRGKV